MTPFVILFFVSFCLVLLVLYSLLRDDMQGSEFELALRRNLKRRQASEGDLYQEDSRGDEQSDALTRGNSRFVCRQQDDYARKMRLGTVRPQMLSWQPKVLLLDNFLSSRECNHIVSLAKDGLEPSTVVDLDTGKSVPDTWRNSSGYFLSTEEESDPTVGPLLERISLYTQVPLENGEPMQVLRYQHGQFYKPHEDSIYGPAADGPAVRVITVLMFLTERVEGGETWFPNATGTCQCGGQQQAGLSVKPKMGRAVVFWSLGWDGQPDQRSLHAGCEVRGGEKWSATKWLLTAKWEEESENIPADLD